VVVGELGAHPLQPANVQVDLAAPDVAPAGHGHPRAPGARQQGPEDQDGRPHPADELVGGLHPQVARGVDGDLVVSALDAGAEPLQHFGHRAAVGDVGNVAYDRPSLGEQGGGHQLQGGVLRPSDVDDPLEAPASGNQ
jgi:hypothetical protein